MSDEKRSQYWTLIEAGYDTNTYEHKLPHGVRIRVQSGGSESMVFVPAPPTEGPYR